MFLVLVVLLARLLFFDPKAVSPLVNARAQSRLEFLFALYKTVLGLTFPIMYVFILLRFTLALNVSELPRYPCVQLLVPQCSSLAAVFRYLPASGVLVVPPASSPLASLLQTVDE